MKKLLLGLVMVFASAPALADVYQCNLISQTDNFAAVKAGTEEMKTSKTKTVIQEGVEDTVVGIVGNKSPFYLPVMQPNQKGDYMTSSGKFAMARKLENGSYFYILTQFSKDAEVAEKADLRRVTIFSLCSRISQGI